MTEVVIESIVKREYGPEQIRRVFGDKVKGIREDLFLSPLIEAIDYFLSRDFLKNKKGLGITYWREMLGCDEGDYSFELVVGGKIIDWEGKVVFIRRLNYGEALRSLRKIILSGPEVQVEKIFSAIEGFIAAYDFNELKVMAAEQLKKKNVRQLRSHVRVFYGV
ncbi:MAG: hypothetical protein AAB724_00265 [Patescibacteria group bacterium]